jgi:hypothetical protein
MPRSAWWPWSNCAAAGAPDLHPRRHAGCRRRVVGVFAPRRARRRPRGGAADGAVADAGFTDERRALGAPTRTRRGRTSRPPWSWTRGPLRRPPPPRPGGAQTQPRHAGRLRLQTVLLPLGLDHPAHGGTVASSSTRRDLRPCSPPRTWRTPWLHHDAVQSVAGCHQGTSPIPGPCHAGGPFAAHPTATDDSRTCAGRTTVPRPHREVGRGH